MASANLDLVRSINADWERGDFSGTHWADTEIEFEFRDWPARGKWTGVAGMAEGWLAWLGAWADFRAEADEYREVDDEHVLVLCHFRGRGRTSGLDVGQVTTKAASLFRVRDGKVTRLVLYAEGEQALADLGLSR